MLTTQKVVFGSVVSYDWPDDMCIISDDYLKGTSGVVRLVDGTELDFTFGQGRYPFMDSLGQLVPEKTEWIRNMNWVVPYTIMVIYLTNEGEVDWWHWPFTALPEGWWRFHQATQPHENLFRIVDAQLRQVNKEPRELFMGTLKQLKEFLQQPEPPYSSGDYAVQELRYGEGERIGTWHNV